MNMDGSRSMEAFCAGEGKDAMRFLGLIGTYIRMTPVVYR